MSINVSAPVTVTGPGPESFPDINELDDQDFADPGQRATYLNFFALYIRYLGDAVVEHDDSPSPVNAPKNPYGYV